MKNSSNLPALPGAGTLKKSGTILSGVSRSALAAGIFIVAAVSASAAFWTLTGDRVPVHDPSIVKEGNTWWCFSTGDGLAVRYGNGTNWTRGIQIFGSERPWWRTYVPEMGTNDPWAPDCRYYNGRYWLYYCVSKFGTKVSAIGLMSCTSIARGDWRDDGLVLNSGNATAYNALDPSLTIDASGNPWLVFGSYFSGLQVVRLDKNTMKPTGTIYPIAQNSGGIENGNVIYSGGYYYLFASRGQCCQGVNSTYNIIYGRSTSITGTFTDKSGKSMRSSGGTVLDAGNVQWKGPGGQAVASNGSGWVIARHAYDANNNGYPTLLINDLQFSGGWPTY